MPNQLTPSIECYALCVKTNFDNAVNAIKSHLTSKNIDCKIDNYGVNSHNEIHFDVVVWGPGIIAMHNIAVAMKYMKDISIELNLFEAAPNGSLGYSIRRL